MTPRAWRALDRWGKLVITSGLAAAIGTAGSFILDNGKSARDVQVQLCQTAQAFLSDETPTPYMTDAARRRTTAAAEAAFVRCMREGR